MTGYVQSARDLLIHRGPDDSGLYISSDHSCILGSRRLAIIDRSKAANQPMPNEDSTLWLVFNGEIYNYVTLQEELSKKGHRFRSASDTEVIIHLYEEHGSKMLQYLDGIFSFVIYDSRNRTLFGARDRFGVKPLYYSISSKRFAFASEPKALLALPDVGREPRLEEVPSYLTFSCVPGPHTLFQDIEKLEPGMQFVVKRDRTFLKERFWTPCGQIESGRSDFVDLTKALDTSLKDAVMKRMISDVPLGATLSGGIDSSSIVTLMTEILGPRVKTFTIGYPGDETDSNSDLHYARLVAQQLSCDHHEIIMTRDDILAVVEEDLPQLSDDPIGSPSETALAHLAKVAKRSGVTVIQVGEGSDELFCGYNKVHQLWRFRKRIAFLRHLFPPGFARCLMRTMDSLKDSVVRQNLQRYSRGEHLYWGYGTVFSERETAQLFNKQLPPNSNPYERLRTRIAEVPDFHKRSYMDQLAIIDLLLQLPERLLMRVDKATMLHGVEAREPFLDPRVLNAAFQVPEKWRASSPKNFLKKYAGMKLLPEITLRPKVGFPTSMKVFLAPAVMSRIRGSVLSKKFVEFGGFNHTYLQQMIASCEAGKGRFFAHLWSLYVLSVWHDRWIEGRAG